MKTALFTDRIPKGLQIVPGYPFVLGFWLKTSPSYCLIRLVSRLCEHFVCMDSHLVRSAASDMKAARGTLMIQLAIHQANLNATDNDYVCRLWREEMDTAVKEASQFAFSKQSAKQDTRKRQQSPSPEFEEVLQGTLSLQTASLLH